MSATTPARRRPVDGVVEAPANSEYHLARDLAAYRELLSIALGELHQARLQQTNVRRTVIRLREELAGAREAQEAAVL